MSSVQQQVWASHGLFQLKKKELRYKEKEEDLKEVEGRNSVLESIVLEEHPGSFLPLRQD